MSKEFFIGWQGKAPEGTGRFLKKVIIGVGAVVIAVAAALPAFQRTVDTDGHFEYGDVKSYRGILVNDPVPMLVAEDDVVYLLVNPLKYGFDPEAAKKHHLQHVTLKGTWIHREGEDMLEVQENSVERVADSEDLTSNPQGMFHELGKTTLRGEIVDSKCHLGVMNPGNLKAHRACAITCIQGGIPPVLLVRDGKGGASYILLVSGEGAALNQDILDLVAEPVQVTGELKKLGDQLILYADADQFSLVE